MYPNHSFVVPAFGRSQYLDACLTSLASQTIVSPIVVATSTPYVDLDQIVERRGARLVVHSLNRGIAHDWNEALKQVDTEWVTIAHQDDVYFPSFTERTLDAVTRVPDASLAFTDYVELAGDIKRSSTLLIWIKRILLESGFLGRSSINSRFAKTNCLRFGCAVPCPAVTLRQTGQLFAFDTTFRVTLDWAAWLEKARQPGSFVWVREPLMGHRIHAGSETSASIQGGLRAAEDRELLGRMWPAPIAWLIARSYVLAYVSNDKKRPNIPRTLLSSSSLADAPSATEPSPGKVRSSSAAVPLVGSSSRTSIACGSSRPPLGSGEKGLGAERNDVSGAERAAPR